jgi:hypothetical protein
MASNESASSLGAMFQGTRNPNEPTRFGRIFKPDDAWLAKAPQETILEPDLPIVDTHHHLWDMPGYRYLLDELLADLRTGHNVVATVFEECRSMYRAHGPEEMKPVGEVEFVAGVAAMSASGRYGSTRICAGIVGYADLTLGDRVAAVLEAEIAAGGGRFRGVRHSAGWHADPIIGNSHGLPGPGLYLSADFRAGMRRGAGPFARRLAVPSPARRSGRSRAGVSLGEHRHVSHGRPAGLRPLWRQEGRGLRQLEGLDEGVGCLPERLGEAGRRHDAAGRL